MAYFLQFKKTVTKQLKIIKKDKKLFSRLEEILLDIQDNPYSKNYKFERLVGPLSGYCSKQLSQKDRIVYRVDDDITVYIDIQ